MTKIILFVACLGTILSAVFYQKGALWGEIMPSLFSIPEILLTLSMGVSLAVAGGFSSFLPIFLISILARNGHLYLVGWSEWIGSDVAIILLGLAGLVEVIVSFFPRSWNVYLRIPLVNILTSFLMVATVLGGKSPWVCWSMALIAAIISGTIGFPFGIARWYAGDFPDRSYPWFIGVGLGGAVSLTILAVFLPIGALVGAGFLTFWVIMRMFDAA